MSDGPQPQWTPEIVRAHLMALIEANDRRYADNFESQEKAVKAALAASEKAVEVAQENAEKWRSNANEWRASMTDREGRFATRSEVEALKERMDRSDGKGHGLNAFWGYLLGAVGLVAAVLAIVGTRVGH